MKDFCGLRMTGLGSGARMFQAFLQRMLVVQGFTGYHFVAYGQSFVVQGLGP